MPKRLAKMAKVAKVALGAMEMGRGWLAEEARVSCNFKKLATASNVLFL